MAVLAGCASPGRQPFPQNDPTLGATGASIVALAALGAARQQTGVPYRYGGADPRSGFDCSGLVHYSYREAGVALPRSARAIQAAIAPLDKNALRPGDLVFFRLGRRTDHVGVYAGNGEFIHAPSSGGSVRRERLADDYWARHYAGAGRVAAP